MPPIAKLTPAQAMYHFLSGYTAKVAGTEKGVVGPAGDILHLLRRALHAAPSLRLRQPAARLIAKHDVDCWLVNTGWTGGNYGAGRRMPIKVTRTLLDRGARRLAEERDVPHRSVFRLRGADLGAGRRAAPALSAQDLADKADFDQTARKPGRHVPARTSCSSRTTSTPTSAPPRRRCDRRRIVRWDAEVGSGRADRRPGLFRRATQSKRLHLKGLATVQGPPFLRSGTCHAGPRHRRRVSSALRSRARAPCAAMT